MLISRRALRKGRIAIHYASIVRDACRDFMLVRVGGLRALKSAVSNILSSRRRDDIVRARACL